MSRTERAIVIWTLVYIGVYFPAFIGTILLLSTLDSSSAVSVAVGYVIFPLHVLAICLPFTVVFLAIRDLFKRSFQDSSHSRGFWRAFWLSLIVGTAGWGAFPYSFIHGFKPRQNVA